MRFFKVFSVFLALLIVSCSTTVDISNKKLTKKATYGVVPFYNFTETPMAGLRASHIVEGVLRAKGYRVLNRHWKENEDLSSDEIKMLIKELSHKGADFIIGGTVNEWRYKTGIDGEPAVSLTIYILDVNQNKIVWSGTLSRSGLSYESIGTTAQKLVEKVIR